MGQLLNIEIGGLKISKSNNDLLFMDPTTKCI